MPAEIDEETFLKLAENAEDCTMKKLADGSVKLKLKTPSRLYTLKVDEARATELLKKLKIKPTEV